MGNFGIQETKDVLEFGIAAANVVSKQLADGFQITDAIAMVPVVVKLPSALSGIKDVPKELGDLDDGEKAELSSMIKEKLDLPDDKVEEAVERFLLAGLSIAAAILYAIENKSGTEAEAQA